MQVIKIYHRCICLQEIRIHWGTVYKRSEQWDLIVFDIEKVYDALCRYYPKGTEDTEHEFGKDEGFIYLQMKRKRVYLKFGVWIWIQ